MRILGFGDNIIDRFVDRGLIYPGGNCVNVAVFARKLGADAAYLGVFGSDSYGAMIRGALTAEGIDFTRSEVRAGGSGLSELTVAEGERVFGGWNGGGVTVSQPLVLDEGLVAYASGFDVVHSSVYSGSEAELGKLRAGDALVSYDFSSEAAYRTPEYLDRVCPFVDLALISCSHLTEEATRTLLSELVARGAGLALATRGTADALVFDGDAFQSAPAELIADSSLIVDTMGCGDAFVAAFMVSLLETGWGRATAPTERTLQTALAAGSAFAARQCLAEGAFGHGQRDPAANMAAAASAPTLSRLDTM
ncbi:MAG: PfkB family carbohydrate kinase [Cryobacterium sp.]